MRGRRSLDVLNFDVVRGTTPLCDCCADGAHASAANVNVYEVAKGKLQDNQVSNERGVVEEECGVARGRVEPGPRGMGAGRWLQR